MLTLHDEELNIKFHNLVFIWAEYDGILGEKYPKTKNGMCWKAPGELKIFQEITCNYGKRSDEPNVLIIGKTTAKLVPIDLLAESRDVYILDYMRDIDTNNKKSILYAVDSSSEIIDEEITDETDLYYEDLDIKLEELTSRHAVFIIGGASVYKYFLKRFPLMHGFVSKINTNTVKWLGSKPTKELISTSEVLYAPSLPLHKIEGVYTSNDYFTTYFMKPQQALLKELYDNIKIQSDLIEFKKLNVSEIELEIVDYKIPASIKLVIDDDNYYASKVYVDELSKILKSSKIFIESYHKYNELEEMESQVYYILHDTENYIFIFKG